MVTRSSQTFWIRFLVRSVQRLADLRVCRCSNKKERPCFNSRDQKWITMAYPVTVVVNFGQMIREPLGRETTQPWGNMADGMGDWEM